MVKFQAWLCSAAAALAGLGAAQAEPALWTLSDDDTTIHILGTVHLLPPETNWRSDRIDAAFAAADTVCFELDAVARAQSIAARMLREGVLPNGDRLTNHLTTDQEQDLRALAAALGAPFVSLDAMAPWFVGLTLEQYFVNAIGFGEGVEFALYPEATAAGKTICELETVEDQLAALSGLAFEIQLSLLVDELSAYDRVEDLLDAQEEELRGLVADWAAGDIGGIAELTSPDAFGHPAAYEALLQRRNAAWTPKIVALLEQSGTVFIAVGAAHLAGPDSVIEMLRGRGYAVEGP